MERLTPILLTFLALAMHPLASPVEAVPARPNIIVILVDDMGYSDIGSYGGEIPTPNLDRLAAGGIRFTRFYNTSRCCPTRASLLTGLYQHLTGVGHMTTEGHYDFDYGTDGYRGNLNRNCVTVAEVLQSAGYHTYMAGKWHVGSFPDDWPLERGFDNFYGSLRGAFSYFKPTELMEGNTPLPPPDPASYYTTDAFTDAAIGWIREQEDNEPFFLYLAYNAPHWPLHAKEEDIARFVGKYMDGWDKLRERRFARQVEMGLFGPEQGISKRDEKVRPWSEVAPDQKVRSDYRMAVYAAQIYSVDENIGKLIGALEETGSLDDTLILFLSDNGGCAEPDNEFGGKSIEDINDPDQRGAISIGRGWANLANTPLREYKNRPQEGGIRTPFIAHWPNGIAGELRGAFVRDSAHILDFMPTVVELSGGRYPETAKGELIHPLEGKSLVPFFSSGSREPVEYLFFEHQNNCAVISGDWKAICRYGEFDWELYNLRDDRNEAHNLATLHPDVISRLDREWLHWALRAKVTPKGDNTGKGYKTPKTDN